MRTFNPIVLLGASLGLVVYVQAVGEFSQQPTMETTARGFFSAQTEQRGDVTPYRGSGRRKALNETPAPVAK